MNPFYTERKHIVEALRGSGIDLILFNKDSVPKSFPCAVILLESETGRLPTGRQFMASDLAWTLFLVVNAHENPDPDNELYEMKEAFRTNWIAMKEKDFAKVEYSRMIRITLKKAGFLMNFRILPIKLIIRRNTKGFLKHGFHFWT